MSGNDIVSVEDYEKIVGYETVERVLNKAEPLRDLHVTHINSTYYGGGVAEVLSSFVLMMNSVGIKTGWRVLQGSPDYFGITKKIHNALQGSDINLSDRKKKIYEDTILENAIRNHLDHDIVIIHDPQPLPMINHYRKRGPWIWRCHIDLTNPNRELWNYLTRFIEKYDAVILSLEEYKRELETPQRFFPPAINPFSIKNKELSEHEIKERLEHYNIPTDLPLVVQISRFDKWKDPEGVIEAFNIIRKEVDCTLVLLGNVATDDPEGEKVYKSLLDKRDERLIILSRQDTALVNALQRKAAVVIQKSKREGFGLTVTEAMWKGSPVVGGNVGGIKYQIKDGENGFLVNSVEETAERVVQLLKDKQLCRNIGENAKETVKQKFLLIHLLERYLEMIGSFESSFSLKN
ncbi:MAG: glycosyltransferase [candidate division Zixibacteria bacterium]|nr:glycosyltransferase [candidate division Zixibacteria bacterium]